MVSIHCRLVSTAHLLLYIFNLIWGLKSEKRSKKIAWSLSHQCTPQIYLKIMAEAAFVEAFDSLLFWRPSGSPTFCIEFCLYFRFALLLETMHRYISKINYVRSSWGSSFLCYFSFFVEIILILRSSFRTMDITTNWRELLIDIALLCVNLTLFRGWEDLTLTWHFFAFFLFTFIIGSSWEENPLRSLSSKGLAECSN